VRHGRDPGPFLPLSRLTTKRGGGGPHPRVLMRMVYESSPGRCSGVVWRLSELVVVLASRSGYTVGAVILLSDDLWASPRHLS